MYLLHTFKGAIWTTLYILCHRRKIEFNSFLIILHKIYIFQVLIEEIEQYILSLR